VADATNQNDGRLNTVPRAAALRGIGIRQLRAAIATGEVRAYQIGGWPRVRLADVDSWIESKRVAATDHARARVEERLAYEGRRTG
jgi:excisionase family DNA binding protein